MKTMVTNIALMICVFCHAQSTPIIEVKPSIDTSVFTKWTSVDVPIISSDANFAIFNIINQPAGSRTMVLRSTNNNWREEFVRAKSGHFTSDNSKAVILNSGDSLNIVTLETGRTEYSPSVSSYKLYKHGNNEWLCYQTKSKELVIRNLISGDTKTFKSVLTYLFNSDLTVLLLQKQTDHNTQVLSWIDLSKGNENDIWEGANAFAFTFDKVANRLVFVVNDDKGKSIWLYETGQEKAVKVASNESLGIDSNLVIDGLVYKTVFSKDEKRIFITLKEKPVAPKSFIVPLDVWSYRDVNLQPKQLRKPLGSSRYVATLDLIKRTIFRLQNAGDESYNIIEQNSDQAIIWVGQQAEVRWNDKTAIDIGCTKNGQRKIANISGQTISPFGRFIVGREKGMSSDLYSYNTQTGQKKNITKNIKGGYDKEYDDIRTDLFKWLLPVTWLRDESGLLIYDRYDIWLVSPENRFAPVDLTNGYGKRNHIIFRLPELYQNSDKTKLVARNDIVFIKGFNRENKEEGIYKIKIDKISDPELLTKGPYKYEIPNTGFNSMQLESAGRKNFLIRRESVSQAPNYFLTTDFKTFKPVTSVYPERNFNWLRSELHTWSGLSGKTIQGILYKPEDFDSTKKYPVLINYYEKMSDNLNVYFLPGFVERNINIPLFLANGYLVFTPDIQYTWGKVGESALNSVVSAAEYLSKFSYVDSKHLGIQGHSFGSYETNYIVTHSHLFAAAMSSCGSSDLISHYGSLDDVFASQGFYETGQGRMGSMLWENPEGYINGSPVLSAHTVTTPILMMANKKDAWNYSQQLELFLGLRRMGKRAWLLQYDNGGHGVDGKDAEDFTTRMLQFFDHYLKDSACPRWMLYGIPAKNKGIDNGYELVKEKEPKTGKWLTPKEGGLLTDEEKKKVEALKHREPITVTIE